MVDQFLAAWKRLEEKLPGFNYFTAAILILFLVGWGILNYLSRDYLWFIIPAFFAILLGALFVWLVLSIINPPTGSNEITRGMRIFLVRFIFFLFVGGIITLITLATTLALWQKPEMICREIGCKMSSPQPDQPTKDFAEAILASGVARPWFAHKTAIFEDRVAMAEFLQDFGCAYCASHARHNPFCSTDYAPQACSTADMVRKNASAPADDAAVRPHIASSDSCASKKLAQVDAPGRILGVDLSHFDRAVDVGSLVQKGVYFVYLKASEGTRIVDPEFTRRWKAAGDAGLIRGAYHTFTTDEPISQARLFLSALAQVNFGPCDLGPALDLGLAQNLVPPYAPQGTLLTYASNADRWLRFVERGMSDAAPDRHAPKPIVFALAGTFPDVDNTTVKLGRYPLWFGSYSVLSTRAPPPAWTSYYIRQFTDGHMGETIAGLPYDVSEFEGSKDALLQLTR